MLHHPKNNISLNTYYFDLLESLFQKREIDRIFIMPLLSKKDSRQFSMNLLGL